MPNCPSAAALSRLVRWLGARARAKEFESTFSFFLFLVLLVIGGKHHVRVDVGYVARNFLHDGLLG